MSVDAIAVKTGGLQLTNPVLLASGVHGSSLAKVLEALKLGAGGAVTKSIGPEPRKGYAEPTLVDVDCGWVNAAGLPNPGAMKFSEELATVKGKALPIIVSVFGGDEKEFARVIGILDDAEVLGFELNLSCPHVEGVGTEIGHDPELVAKVVMAAKASTRKPVFAKLSPNTDRLAEVGRAAEQAGADGLTAINTVRAMAIDIGSGGPSLSNGYGGLSGPAIRPVALRCVYELSEAVDIPIFGCGGVTGWRDAVQFFLAGASAVQVGSATIGKLALFNDINVGILEYLESKGYRNLGEIVGTAHGGGRRGG